MDTSSPTDEALHPTANTLSLRLPEREKVVQPERFRRMKLKKQGANKKRDS